MNDHAKGTLPRAGKGPLGPPPVLDGALGAVVDVVAGWPGVSASVHWYLFDQSRVDGVDFYVGEEELGHLHLDGSIHLATSPGLGEALIAEGVAKPFRYQQAGLSNRSDASVSTPRSPCSAATTSICERKTVFRRRIQTSIGAGVTL